MTRDPETPNGFQDADYEMYEMQLAGREEANRRKRGKCSHTWTGRADGPGVEFICNHCGFLWADKDACEKHWDECSAGHCTCVAFTKVPS